jgi:hypothetical protein
MIEIQKAFVNAKPVTIVYLTVFGREKLKEYAHTLAKILEKMLE